MTILFIRVNREKSEVGYVLNNVHLKEMEKVIGLGYIIKENLNILGKKFIINELLEKKIDAYSEQIRDVTFHNIIRLYAYILGRIRYNNYMA